MNPLKIIAETAQGYEGKPALAEMLVNAAASSGADAVKFQVIYADELATPDYKHFKLFQSLEMQDDVWRQLADTARTRKIEIYLDVFGPRSLKLAESVQAAAIKVHSTDMQNPDLLKSVATSSVPLVVLSVSGCFLEEIDQAVAIMDKKEIVLLHGFQTYPTPVDSNQIRRLSDLKTRFEGRNNIHYGFGDHVPVDDELRFTLSAVAVGLGAEYLEKHLTLSKVMKFEDHESALSPDEFSRFVREMKQCRQALGEDSPSDGALKMHASELDYRTMTHKHVISSRPLEAGAVLRPESVTLKRTAATGPVYDLKAVYGKRLKRRVEAGTAITTDMLEEKS